MQETARDRWCPMLILIHFLLRHRGVRAAEPSTVLSPFSKLVWIFVRKSEPWWSSSMNANVSLWSWLSIVSFPIVVAANKILSTNLKLLLLKGGQTFSGCMVLQHKSSGQKIPSFHENDGSLNRIADIYQCQWKLSAYNHQAGVLSYCLSSLFHFLQYIDIYAYLDKWTIYVMIDD